MSITSILAAQSSILNNPAFQLALESPAVQFRFKDGVPTYVGAQLLPEIYDTEKDMINVTDYTIRFGEAHETLPHTSTTVSTRIDTAQMMIQGMEMSAAFELSEDKYYQMARASGRNFDADAWVVSAVNDGILKKFAARSELRNWSAIINNGVFNRRASNGEKISGDYVLPARNPLLFALDLTGWANPTVNPLDIIETMATRLTARGYEKVGRIYTSPKLLKLLMRHPIVVQRVKGANAAGFDRVSRTELDTLMTDMYQLPVVQTYDEIYEPDFGPKVRFLPEDTFVMIADTSSYVELSTSDGKPFISMNGTLGRTVVLNHTAMFGSGGAPRPKPAGGEGIYVGPRNKVEQLPHAIGMEGRKRSGPVLNDPDSVAVIKVML